MWDKCSSLHFYYLLISVQVGINTAETLLALNPEEPMNTKVHEIGKSVGFCLFFILVLNSGIWFRRSYAETAFTFPWIETTSSMTSHDFFNTEFLIYIKQVK